MLGGIDLLINEEIAKEFASLFLSVSVETAKQAHEYLGTHENLTGYLKYPVKHEIFPKDNPKFAEYFEKIPFLSYNIPKYYLADYPKDSVQYSAIFSGYSNKHLDCRDIKEFGKLLQFVSNHDNLKKLLIQEDAEENIKTKLKLLIQETVERYMYMTNATNIIPNDIEDKIKPFVLEKVLRYLCKQLDIDIYIPICLITFEDDVIKLSEHIEVIKISEDIQKSRQKACTYEMNNEDWIASCATHMIVLHNYHFDNSENFSVNSATQDYNAYPLHKIDMIIAAIRIVTGFSVGYEQILSYPINWVDEICADLVPLYGAKGHFVNPKELEKFWMHLSISKVNHEQAEQIQEIYSKIVACETNSKNNNLIFALKRFNRCMLRNENDDMAIDATIGLEALLSGGTKGEITYTISNRIPIVFSYEHNDIYSPLNCRDIMKKIYTYRSKIVHGSVIKDKDKYCELNDKKLAIEKIAVDFLRYTLLFLIRNQDYIDSKKIDSYIDSKLADRLS